MFKSINTDIWNNDSLIKILKEGGVAVMPTDTIYGIVGQALDMSVVNRIYSIRRRSPEKPCIILIGDLAELEKFSITISSEQEREIKKYWPGPVSIIFDCSRAELSYLHRGTNSLAIRFPDMPDLQKFLLKTGPLIAPSANTEGEKPSLNIEQAQKYFGDKVDFYLDAGEIIRDPSKIVRLYNDGTVSIIRQ